MNQKNSMYVKITRQEKKNNTTGDIDAVETDLRAEEVVHRKVADDVDDVVKVSAKAAPNTGAAPFFQLLPSTATSTRTQSAFGINYRIRLMRWVRLTTGFLPPSEQALRARDKLDGDAEEELEDFEDSQLI